ncbi:MAG: bacteriochlorophyll 4-vinyl reductase [Gammaproteobacteria bacterium]
MHGPPVTDGAARVGPNAILQLVGTLEQRGGATLATAVFEHAGLATYLSAPPRAMVPEAEVARLNAAVGALLPAAGAVAALAEAGRRTGRYLLAHRIPAPARALLRVLPAPLAAPLLLGAIRRHAWTFAGSGVVRVGSRPQPWIEIAPNPLAQPDCPWHCAVFGELFGTLVSAGCGVAHPCCCARGDACCRFEIVPARHASLSVR